MQATKLYDNGYSHILVDDDSVRVIRNSDSKLSPKSVKILDDIYIELGRPMRDFRESLVETRVPIVVKQIPLDKTNIKGYQIIRMHTGNVDDKVVVNVTETNGKINKISFNRELKHDKEFRKYCKLSALHLLQIPALNLDDRELALKFESQLDAIMLSIFKGLGKFLEAKYLPGEINIRVDVDEQLERVLLYYNKKLGSYEFVAISCD